MTPNRIFQGILALFVTSCIHTMKPENTLKSTITAWINQQNTAAIAELMTESFQGTTLFGHEFSPKITWIETWQKIFQMFPDLSFVTGNSVNSGETLLMTGTLSASLLGKKKPEFDFSVPCCIQVEMTNQGLEKIIFYADLSRPIELAKTHEPEDRKNPRVTGLGGAFFKSKDPKVLADWYNTHLGLSINEYSYMMFPWRDFENPSLQKSTTFSIFKESTDYLDPSKSSFMFNFRVNNLDDLLADLSSNGVHVVGEIQRFEYGNFGWIMDPEGNKIELWEPVDAQL
jgi:predicted enzyme related to lactoylglutathione lyase